MVYQVVLDTAVALVKVRQRLEHPLRRRIGGVFPACPVPALPRHPLARFSNIARPEADLAQGIVVGDGPAFSADCRQNYGDNHARAVLARRAVHQGWQAAWLRQFRYQRRKLLAKDVHLASITVAEVRLESVGWRAAKQWEVTIRDLSRRGEDVGPLRKFSVIADVEDAAQARLDQPGLAVGVQTVEAV